MALGALIGAYQEDDSGGLRALLPLAGRTLIEFQARCLAAAGTAPIVVFVERIPPALQQAFERLRLEGISVVAVSDGEDAAARFEAGATILLISDGLAPSAELVARLAAESEPVLLTVPDDEANAEFERIDAQSRWAGLGVIDSGSLRATAAMLGDWDIQSTLLRRALQDGAARLPLLPEDPRPVLAQGADRLGEFERGLISGSRGVRRDWASRYILPPIEEFATIRLADTAVAPAHLIWAALLMTLGGAFAFTRGWLWAGLALLVLSTPLDRIARRLGVLRLRPLPARLLSERLLWPAAGLALLALGWWETRNGGGWGALASAAAAVAFAEAARIEQGGSDPPGAIWLLSRRNAILLALPFAAFGAWTALLVVVAVYAAVSFFVVQHVRHDLAGG